MKPVFVSLLIFCSIWSSVSGQTYNPIFDQNSIPPSPESQAFLQYGVYPVDYSTGVPKIEIPIYDIKSGSLALPVSLSYHASGIKMTEIASSTGLGWSLNAGGLVGRTINGYEDENGFLNMVSYDRNFLDNYTPPPGGNYSLPYAFVHDIAFGGQDGRSDDYYYAVGDKLVGKFVYDINKQIRQRAFTNNIIVRHSDNTWEITGEDGTHYIFKDIENALSPRAGFVPSSWRITMIISADYKDTISFEYGRYPGVEYAVETQTFNDQNPQNKAQISSLPPFQSRFTPIVSDASVLVTRIKFKNGSLTFTYEGGRRDLMSHRLSTITINSVNSSGTETPLKSYQLMHSYFDPGTPNPNAYQVKLRLDEIKLFDQNNTYINSYHFHYNSMIMPPMSNTYNLSNLPGGAPAAVNSMDLWGYYNGQLNSSLLPDLPANLGGPANRSANDTYSRAESLESIDFPTGGSTTFEFEGNQSIGTIPDPNVGGLRIKKITSVAGPASTPVVKQYQYNSSILLTPNSEPGRYSYAQSYDLGGAFSASISSFDQFPTKTVYFSTPIVSLGSLNGSPVMYYSVTETEDDGNGQKHQTVYNYDFDNDRSYTIPETSKYGDVAYSDKYWGRSSLASTMYYKYVNGAFVLNKSLSNHYNTYQTATVNTGINCFIQLLHSIDPTSTVDNPPVPYPYPGGYTAPPRFYDFNYFDVYEEAGIRKVVQTEETNYDDNGVATVNKVTNFDYASTEHAYPTKKTEINSDGGQFISVFKYPFDFRGQAPYDAMISENLVLPTVQVSTYKNSTAQLISSATTNYKDWGNNVIAPTSVAIQNGNYPQETSVNLFYDNSMAKVVQSQKRNGLYTAYQWGYQHQYPVAEVKNARNDYLGTIVLGDASAGYSTEVGDGTFVTTTAPQTTNFTTGADNGSVTFSETAFFLPAGSYVDLGCTLTGPNGYTNSFGLSTLSSPSKTIAGLAAGSYSLVSHAEFHVNPVDAYNANLDISFPQSVNYTGARQFFFESFEEGAGNGTFNDSKTGHYSFTGAYSKALSGLSSGNYVLSYWSKSGGVWSYQKVPVPVTGTTYTINIPSGQIDDVRFCSTEAQMTTYTYDPLVGMTSSSDENGQPVYYEYDALQRLTNVRDKDGNVVKHIEYHYQGQ